jgi:RNA polymerase sigma-70 factor (ECF subfamily)
MVTRMSNRASPGPDEHPPGDDAPATPGFDEFYAAHFGRLVTQLCAYTGDVEQARDLVQEAFARALPRWSRLAGYDDPAGWVHRVAWNLATSQWRRMRTFHRYARAHRERYAPEPNPDRIMLERCLATLPNNQRKVIVMHYLGDMSVAQIGETMRVPDGTVKSWLYRGRQALAAQMGGEREARDG